MFQDIFRQCNHKTPIFHYNPQESQIWATCAPLNNLSRLIRIIESCRWFFQAQIHPRVYFCKWCLKMLLSNSQVSLKLFYVGLTLLSHSLSCLTSGHFLIVKEQAYIQLYLIKEFSALISSIFGLIQQSFWSKHEVQMDFYSKLIENN